MRDAPFLPAAELLTRQRTAFLNEGAPDLAHRRAALARLKTAVLGHRRRLEAAAEADFGRRAPIETALTDLVPVVQSITHMRRHLDRWMRPERRRVGLLMQPGRAEVRYQPLGVVGIMSAWNYPVSLALVPLATALAAGNRSLVKLSEKAPATADALATLLSDTFDETEVAVVTGGPEVAGSFAALPFDHLFFTGSTAIGRKVAQAAAANLTPVTLELGGKSPVILTADADPGLAARDLAFGKMTNAGQTCIAPDYVLAAPEQISPLVEAFARAVQTAAPDGLASPDLTTLLDEDGFARQRALLEDAKAHGARIVECLPQDASAHARAFAPTLVLDAAPKMRLMQEEIFGPLLPVVACNSTETAITFVNARPRPLALYVYGHDRAAIDAVLSRTTSGNAAVNGVMLHYAVDTLPFGGVGDSGMGAYHGKEGFRRLSHAKGVFRPASRHPSRLARAPYGKLARLAARLVLR
ncbi:coniferyl aldehyde dehydrogenase [Tropicimonas marinistellae]|uniref:coniferyl aldehyde dehydrogenase n=1 Tax=Tropicimonas marinistellae TaxID=1739787 RepID=UPI0008359179|nr:coniferyl aldehyde dehydrogenase [Tropicimonas marinistellae]